MNVFLYQSKDFLNLQPPRRSLDGYKHVVDMEYCSAVTSEGPHFPPEAAKAKEAAQNAPSAQTTLEYHEIMEGNITKKLFLTVENESQSPYVCLFYGTLNLSTLFRTEEMIGGLQQLSWKKVDVSFHSAFWPFFAHNNIHVKSWKIC